jgi:hypothetical protein
VYDPDLFASERAAHGRLGNLGKLNAVAAADDNVVAFARRTRDSSRVALFVGNFSPAVRSHYRIGLPRPDDFAEAEQGSRQPLRRTVRGLGNGVHFRSQGGPHIDQPAAFVGSGDAEGCARK